MARKVLFFLNKMFLFFQAKDSWQMNTEEKLEQAEKLKTRGTEFFQVTVVSI